MNEKQGLNIYIIVSFKVLMGKQISRCKHDSIAFWFLPCYYSFVDITIFAV